MNVYLIRHGQTKGNSEHRYIGSRSDEPVTAEGLEMLSGTDHGISPGIVITSGLLRTRQTASVMFPQISQKACAGLNEADFGEFDGKTYTELKDLPAFREYIESAGAVAPPGGESNPDFARRVAAAFNEELTYIIGAGIDEPAFVIHGGTIMALMAYYTGGERPFYEWMTANGCGYKVKINEDGWLKGDKRFTEYEELK